MIGHIIAAASVFPATGEDLMAIQKFKAVTVRER